MKKAIVIGAVAVALLYVASPYFAVWSLYHSATTGDSTALEDKVDWSKVREGLKEQLNGAMLASAMNAQQDDSLASGLMALAGPMMVDRIVDTYVSPQGLVQALRAAADQPKPAASAATTPAGATIEDQTVTNQQPASQKLPRIQAKSIAYAFFSSPTRFRLSLGDDKKGVVNVLMRFSPGGWEVYRVVLPEQLLKEMAKK